MRFAGLLLVAAVVAACQSASPPTSGDTNVAPNSSTASRVDLGQLFDLHVGESRIIDGKLTITLTAVPSDSRCPIDVVCVWAGDAVITLDAALSGRSSTLSLHSTLEPKTGEVGGYTVSFLSLTPFTTSGKTIPAGEYIAHLVVNRK